MPVSDLVFVRDLRLAAIIGMDPAEANVRQQVALDLEIAVAPPPQSRPSSAPPACGEEAKRETADGSLGGDGEDSDSRAARNAAASPSVDYARLIRRLRALAENQRFILLEELAEAVAGLIFAEFPAASEVKIRCAKPRVFADVAAAGVEIKRPRPESAAA